MPAVTFNLRYPGQYFDQESDLHYNYHRSYSAAVGRYTQSDPIGLDGGWNRFGYAEQNPITFTDPLGEKAQRGDNSLYPPTQNCSCFRNCMQADPPQTIVAACSVMPDIKIFGIKAINLSSAICEPIIKGAVYCSSVCSDFCSGKKCESPYPDK